MQCRGMHVRCSFVKSIDNARSIDEKCKIFSKHHVRSTFLIVHDFAIFSALYIHRFIYKLEQLLNFPLTFIFLTLLSFVRSKFLKTLRYQIQRSSQLSYCSTCFELYAILSNLPDISDCFQTSVYRRGVLKEMKYTLNVITLKVNL